jgi:serine/threonine-protein kinase
MTWDDQQAWQRIEPILEAALDLAPVDRDAYLDRVCGSDQALRARVRAMLAAGEDPDSLLEQSITALAGPLLADLEHADGGDAVVTIGVGTMVGPWKLVRELGHGGMGDVFLAERADGQFAQTAALKVVRRGREHDPLLVRRFVEERRILASLSHPHVAQLLDGGVTATSQPWFAMEYIAGQPLDVYCAARALDVAQRLALMEQVVSAVAYAHSNLLVHRDLKPGNILVTDAGDVKLLDFGIAKLLDGDVSAESGLTMAFVMTPEYAAPEQVRGEAITTATDIYALGAVLYELLTGRSAHQFTKRTAAEIERVVCETDPEPPGAAQRTARTRDASGGSTRPNLLRISSDVDTLVLTALQKEPSRRYASADALLADLRRYRLGMPLLARPDTVGYRVSKFVGRHRLGVAAAGVIVLALVGGVAGVLWQARAARLEAARADRVVEFLVDLLQQADPNITQGKEFSVRELLDRGTQRLDSILVNEPAMQAELYEVIGNSYAHLGRIAQADTLHRKGLDAARRFYGRGSDEVLNQTMAVGWGLNDQGLYAAADTLLTAAIVETREAHRPESQALSDAIDILATAKKRLDHPVIAESLYRQSLAMQIRLTGAQDTITASRLSDLGALLSAQDDRLAAADSALSAAQESRRRAGRTLDTPFLAGESSLAMIRMKRGDLNEADRRISVAIAGFERLESPAGINIARALNRLALLRSMQFRMTEATAASERALGMFRLRVAPDHPEALTTQSLLASYQAVRGEPAAALASARAAYDGLSKKLGPRHALTIAAAQRLAVIALDAGASRDAMVLADSVLHLAREKFGAVTSTFAPALGVAAATRSATGDTVSADSLFHAAVGSLAHSTRVDSMALPDIAVHYAAFLARRQRDGEARALRRTAARLIPAGADESLPIVRALRGPLP